MIKKISLLLFVFILNFIATHAQSDSVVLKYIDTYRDLAIREMLRTGIPASIKLAQAIHESQAGTSNLALRSNNHFGLKCKADWKGDGVNHDDDLPQECFRKYETVEQSYIDQSNYLRQRSWYAFLFKIPITNYTDWAYGLKKAGYATNPKYAPTLIGLIEKYNLNQYTLQQQSDTAVVEVKPKETVVEISKIDSVISKPKIDTIISNTPKMILHTVQSSETLYSIASRYGISVEELVKWNELTSDILKADQQLKIFLHE